MINYLLAWLAGAASILAVLFFLLLKSADKKLKEAENKAEYLSAALEIEKTVSRSVARQKKENEEIEQKAHSDNRLDNFNAGIELLRQQAQKGKQRNSGS